MFGNSKKVLIHTGNILKMNAIQMKALSKSFEEITESLKLILACGERKLEDKTLEIRSLDVDDEVDPKTLSTTVKIFLKSVTKEALTEALEKVMTVLNGKRLENAILAYPHELTKEPAEDLLDVWTVLEDYVNSEKIVRLGIADLETDVFIALFNKVKIKPNIFHVTSERCCHVPPDLQAFAKDNDIQLLTHNDPPDILPDDVATKMFGDHKVYWITRYQSYITCRGVLTTKGYLLALKD